MKTLIAKSIIKSTSDNCTFKQDTIKEIEKIKNARGSKSISITEFEENLKKETEQEPYNWHNILYLISLALTKTIGTNQEELVIKNVQNINELFQNELKKNYASLKSSNAIKSPKIVSKILEHLNSNFKNEKLALIVIDGLSFWQYILLKDKIEGLKKEQHIYSGCHQLPNYQDKLFSKATYLILTTNKIRKMKNAYGNYIGKIKVSMTLK